MRWRLSYKAGSGFEYVVQPKRRSRRKCDEEEADDAWPEPGQSWSMLRGWQSQALTQEAEETQALRLSALACSIQVGEDLVGCGRGKARFRVQVSDFVDSSLSPGKAFCFAFKRHISVASNNPFLDFAHLRKSLNLSVGTGCAQVPPSKDALSSLPLEILDSVTSNCIEINLDLVAFVKKTDSSSLRSYVFTPNERATLHAIPRKAWLYISSIPLFHTSLLLRDRVVADIQRRIRDTDGTFSPHTLFPHGRATLHLDSSDNGSECFTEPLDVGVKMHGDQPRGLRNVSHHLWGFVTRLDIGAVWAVQTKCLTTPLKRLIGFEGMFYALCHITVRCRVVGFERNDPATTCRTIAQGDCWQTLVDALYGPEGAFEQIAEDVGRAIDVGIWGALTGRTGIWPGYCLRPTCTLDEARPCMARLPALSHRMPIFDIELLPEAGEGILDF